MKMLPLMLFLLLFVAPAAAETATPPPIAVETLIQTTTTWDGATLPAYPEGQPEITMLKITVAPGARLPWHKHPVINTGILLSGELEVTHEDGRTNRLGPWDTISEVVNTWHYGRNPGEVPAVILVVYSGAVGLPLSIPREEPDADSEY